MSLIYWNYMRVYTCLITTLDILFVNNQLFFLFFATFTFLTYYFFADLIIHWRSKEFANVLNDIGSKHNIVIFLSKLDLKFIFLLISTFNIVCSVVCSIYFLWWNSEKNLNEHAYIPHHIEWRTDIPKINGFSVLFGFWGKHCK